MKKEQLEKGFGLNTGGKRFARLFFQPLLIAWRWAAPPNLKCYDNESSNT